VLAVVLAAATAVRADPLPLQPFLARTLEAARARGHVPGMAAWLQVGDSVAEAAAGVRAAGHPEAATVRDRWHLGSDTKAFTATLIARLAEKGVLGFDDTLAASLTLRALQQALTLRQPRPGLIHHSDRGLQYANAAYQARLQAHGIVPSMSRLGNCWDNAVAESFFATLKTELGRRQRWTTRGEAEQALHGFIDRWYNHQRRHSALGYRSPIDYERQLARLRSA